MLLSPNGGKVDVGQSSHLYPLYLSDPTVSFLSLELGDKEKIYIYILELGYVWIMFFKT